MKKILVVLFALAILTGSAFAAELSQVKMSYSFPIATVASSTVTSLWIFNAPCDLRISGADVVTVTTTDNAAPCAVAASYTTIFEILDDGTAVQSYTILTPGLTANTPQAFTVVNSTAVILKGSVVSCRARSLVNGKAVVTPVVTMHYAPTR
jgi:hypothetical protein